MTSQYNRILIVTRDSEQKSYGIFSQSSLFKESHKPFNLAHHHIEQLALKSMLSQACVWEQVVKL
jgi:hypothetical protein